MDAKVTCKSAPIWLTTFVLSYPGTQLSRGQAGGWPRPELPRGVLGGAQLWGQGSVLTAEGASQRQPPALGDRDATVIRHGAARGPCPRSRVP